LPVWNDVHLFRWHYDGTDLAFFRTIHYPDISCKGCGMKGSTRISPFPGDLVPIPVRSGLSTHKIRSGNHLIRLSQKTIGHFFWHISRKYAAASSDLDDPPQVSFYP